jgi:excinuclease ABC subunit B
LNGKNTENVDLMARPIHEEHYAMPLAAEELSEYSSERSLEELIAEAKADMESAAKALDFMAAAKYRDRMYELQQKLEDCKKR